VREPAEFAAGHLPGAANLPLAEIASRLAEIPGDRPLFLVCHSGARSLRAARFLAQVGYVRVTNMRGGTAAWLAAGLAGGRGGAVRAERAERSRFHGTAGASSISA
jgi:rhodanese-related sulfurtransferase